VAAMTLDDLKEIDQQKEKLQRNTEQFVNGRPANNVLLTGARGTGKSTLVKALLSEFSKDGLRLVEVEKEDLVDLPEIVEILRNRPESFVVFCDDLSFEATEPGYKSLKVVLDGSISSTSDNVVVYATSNRRHLMPEFMAENLQTQYVGEEIRPGDTTEEKVSLSERFGLWLSFYAFDQDEYLKVAQYWLMHLGISEMTAEIRQAALLFSLTRGARSGRVAYQFARDYVGRIALKDASK
jgi:predicted AAA+ superfamily ATPase